MKWVEIITLRSLASINRQFVAELLKEVHESDLPNGTPTHLIGVKVYYHSVVDTDLSIHIYWKSESGRQDKSSLGLRFFSALRNLGLLNHSLWIETDAREFSTGNYGGETLLYPAAADKETYKNSLKDF